MEEQQASETPAVELSLRDRVRIVIFEADTPLGQTFDIWLIIFILLSVAAVLANTVDWIHAEYGAWLYVAEWLFTGVFTIEYLVRLWCIQKTWAYARSFYGIVDLICIIPMYLSLWVVGSQYLLVTRIIRVMRIFRVLRMVRYVGEAELISQALVASRRKITVFILSVFAMTVVFGSLMYLVEGGRNGSFASIPDSIYWAVTTMTTVGYGDIVPESGLGRALATVIMVMGYGIIAVPTGIVTMELNEANRRRANTRTCPACSAEGHSREAAFCWRCGEQLYRPAQTKD